MRFTADELAAATRGRRRGPDVVLEGATTDSRAVAAGQLFVPLVGERDGHDFIAAAVASGAAAYLTARPVAPEVGGATAIEVGDTLAALADLGRLARSRLADPVVAVTGSVGKTSVKDLATGALRARFATAAAPNSFNNEIGVPLTLVRAPEGTEAVVVEMGARGVGHIAHLCGIARPTVGVVTAVGAAHLELFGSIEDVARGKGELVEALPPSGVAVLNADDERVARMASRTQARVLRYGVAAAADVVATDVVLDAELRPRFRLRSPWGTADVALLVRGRHMVANALAAASAALSVGVAPEAVAAGLATATLSPWRMEVRRTPSGVLVVNDAYNANPMSMRAALESLAALPARRRVAVLGPMAELGAASAAAHAAVADLARELGIDVVAVGSQDYGVAALADVDAGLCRLREMGLGHDDAVLVKGSRVAGLERLAGRLEAGEQVTSGAGQGSGG